MTESRPHYEEVASEINEVAEEWLRASGRFPAFFELHDQYTGMIHGDDIKPAAVDLLHRMETFVDSQPDGTGVATMRASVLFLRDQLRFHKLIEPAWVAGGSPVRGEIARAADNDWRVLGEECGYAGLKEITEKEMRSFEPPEPPRPLNREERRKAKGKRQR